MRALVGLGTRSDSSDRSVSVVLGMHKHNAAHPSPLKAFDIMSVRAGYDVELVIWRV